MTPEAQRIAIAEACGWTNIHTSGPMNKLIGDQQGYKDGHGFSVPNYPADLNAMHEAEKVLTTTQKRVYADRLVIQCNNTTQDYHKPHPLYWVELTYNATATQRAEAFLRTLNLWKETT